MGCIINCMFFVYMIKNPDNILYVGITENPEKRVRHHNKKQGAKFTKIKHNFDIVFLEQYKTIAEARQREIQIKKWRRNKKEMLINRYKYGLETRLS